ncbi:hypothetical protein L226DRAFT_45098 [Lentinus tigrinus ALCF2SS1-7]|uniref:uncharacterized protein n=1 Tax=Lentinus tigrinus ALCF2SS1-7 TaxID=1328758 RepID=UPI001165E71E|nr:hypothetical protein L226DRAFT_45098 [Lentinus tigrinus ALCF2SS1-7]
MAVPTSSSASSSCSYASPLSLPMLLGVMWVPAVFSHSTRIGLPSTPEHPQDRNPTPAASNHHDIRSQSLTSRCPPTASPRTPKYHVRCAVRER